MTLSTSGYTVGANMPLNHARILYVPITGTVTAGGTNGGYATNDYTFQKWACGALSATWVIVTAADASVDTVFIASHNLGTTGCTVEISTAATVGGAHTTRATITPTDNSAIAAMFNNVGVAYVVREVKLTITGASSDAQIGIIRAGVAMQMERPIYGGITPIGLSRLVETRHSISETGQWLGRTVQLQASRTQMPWQNLSASWVRSTWATFALTLPQTPFGFIQNPIRMPESVAWCWTDEVPQPENMGVRDLMAVTLNITGLLE